MNILKTSALSAAFVVVKMLTLLAINKIVSILVGPSGLAMLGQFQNFQSVTRSIAQGGINAGIVKYISEGYGNKRSLLKVLFTSVVVTMTFSIITGVLIYLFSKDISYYVFDDGGYTYIIKVFSITIFFYSINQLALSVLNGMEAIKSLTIINIAQSLSGLSLTLVLVYFYEIKGLYLSLVTNQAIFIFFLFFLKDLRSDLIEAVKMCLFSQSYARSLISYSGMAFSSAIILPLTMYLIRKNIDHSIGADAAGYWQATVYISSVYMMIISTVLATYYLPRLSKVTFNYEIRSEIYTGLNFFLPLYIVFALSLYFLDEFVITTLFSKDFGFVAKLLPYYLIGDFFKITSLLFSYIMLSKKTVKLYFMTEVTNYIMLLCLSSFFLGYYGLQGVAWAYPINYLTYMIIMLLSLQKYYRG